MTHIIDAVAKKIHHGERLSTADALALYETPELWPIGELADSINRQRNNEAVFFNVNRHINPTNICSLSCKFCAYSRKIGEEGGYAYSIDEMVTKAGEAQAQGATEIHMVGGLHPRWKYDHYRDMVKAIKGAFPALHLKAFTAVELDWLARKARKSIAEVLLELKEAGLGSLPGGGAEIFHPEIRDAICDTKVSAEQWLDTHRLAHSMGLHSNATMLYGHIENFAHRVDHMDRLRQLQDESRGFNAFIPLSFQPFQNEMGVDRYTFGYDDLKTIAIARLFLDNFRHIKAYWVMLGQDIAQLALRFGANDLDGTVIEEKISRMAGGRAGMVMSRGFIEDLIRKADRNPCERDTLYRPIKPSTPRTLPSEGLMEAPQVGNEGAWPSAHLANYAAHGELFALARAVTAITLKTRPRTLGSALYLRLADHTNGASAVRSVAASLAAISDKSRLAPQVLVIDLAAQASQAATEAEDAPNSGAVSRLSDVVKALRQAYPDLAVHLAGLKTLWRMAREDGLSVESLLKLFAPKDIAEVGSSPAESEADLTTSELLNLFAAIRSAGIPCAARVELRAPARSQDAPTNYSTSASPDWPGLVRRAEALHEWHKKTQGLSSISVEVAPDSFVTPWEYLRAVAVVRLAAPTIPSVVAPLMLMPTLSPKAGLGTAEWQHPAEKFAALALHFGADDLGLLATDKLDISAVLVQIRASGFTPSLRSAALVQPTKSHELLNELQKVRHLPQAHAANAGVML